MSPVSYFRRSDNYADTGGLDNNPLKLNIFNYCLLDNNLNNALITKWLSSTDFSLVKHVKKILNNPLTEMVSVDTCLFARKIDDEVILLLAYRACGWLYAYPIVSISFIISLFDLITTDKVKMQIFTILIIPLVFSYPEKTKEVCQKLLDSASNKTKAIIEEIHSSLNEYKQYFDEEKQLKELDADVDNWRYRNNIYNNIYRDSMKKSMKDSIATLICSQEHILYGRGTVQEINRGENFEYVENIFHMYRSPSIETSFLLNVSPIHTVKLLDQYRCYRCYE